MSKFQTTIKELLGDGVGMCRWCAVIITYRCHSILSKQLSLELFISTLSMTGPWREESL